jgi:outer membrane protein OmpA-like peptidoglycan-associated protein
VQKLAYIIAIGLLVFTKTFVSVAHAQEDNSKKEIALEFIKNNVEVQPGEVFNNILIIDNTSDRTQQFDIFINTPNHWKLIGEATQRIALRPGEREYYPIQVVSSGSSKGGVGYAIIATANDINGNMINSENCFLNIPRKSSLNARTINTYRYFNLETREAEFQIQITNEGNTDQSVNIKVEPGPSIIIPGNTTDFTQKTIRLEPKQDSIIDFKVKLKDDIDTELFKSHRAEINISGSDTIIKQTTWFNYLDWEYNNHIPEGQRPLILEITGFDVFSQNKPFWQLRAHGNILFKNQQNLRYDYQILKRSEQSLNELWVQSRFLTEYNRHNKFIIGIGDNRGSFEQSLFGRGFWVEQEIKQNHRLHFTLIKKMEYDSYTAAGSYSYNLKIPLKTEIGGAYTENRNTYNESRLAYGELSGTLQQYGQFRLRYGQSINYFRNPNYSEESFTGFGIRANYSNKINEISTTTRLDFGSPYYSGRNKGRLTLNSQASRALSDKYHLSATYIQQEYRPATLYNNTLSQTEYTQSSISRLILTLSPERNIQLFTGPIYEFKRTNNYNTDTDNSPFTTQRILGELGIRINESYTQNSVSFSFGYGHTFIRSVPESIAENRSIEQNFPSAEIRANFRRSNWNIYSVYQQGPQNLSEQFAYALVPFTSRSIMIIPSYQRYLYKEDIKLTMRGTYTGNLTAKSSRIGVNTRLDWMMPKGWSAFLENTLSITYQSPYSQGSTINNRSQTSSYFRIGLKKIFDFNQPRIKYVDLDAVFYRDNNGDRLRSADEPGVSNVLANLKRIPQEGEDPGVKSVFNNVELLSEFEGKIALRDIPVGTYEVSYIPTNGREGNFITDRASKVVKLNNDSTLYIPFTDKNKVFGHVVIKQAEHSIMENPPLDNIKIVAKGDGKTQSTLTDKNGYFEMYIPVADYYRIETGNIDPEHYTLQQPFYIVKFNGYKEFELNFVFEEKERRIVFDDDLDLTDFDDYTETEDEPTNEDIDTEEDIDINVQPLRQINVKGEIRDEKTMNPVHARISIINQKNDVPITETVSSQRTGIYAASLISSEPLYIKVKAKGYWTHSENLRTGKITTFDNINKDVRLSPIAVGQKMETPELTFEENQSSLTPRAQVELENLLGILHENSHVTINIEGHSDGREALDEESSNISLKRAQAVAEYLKRGGIRPERITNVKGKKDKSPIITEVDSQTRAENRRVEIIVSGF